MARLQTSLKKKLNTNQVSIKQHQIKGKKQLQSEIEEIFQPGIVQPTGPISRDASSTGDHSSKTLSKQLKSSGTLESIYASTQSTEPTAREVHPTDESSTPVNSIQPSTTKYVGSADRSDQPTVTEAYFTNQSASTILLKQPISTESPSNTTYDTTRLYEATTGDGSYTYEFFTTAFSEELLSADSPKKTDGSYQPNETLNVTCAPYIGEDRLHLNPD